MENLVEEYIFKDLPKGKKKSDFRCYRFWANIKDNMGSEMNMNVTLNNEPQRFLLRN